MSALAKFSIHLTPHAASCRVLLNETDISHQVRSINVYKAAPTEVPVVILEMATEDIEITGEGVSLLSSGIDAIEVLDSINPAELEAQALQDTSFGESTAAKMLELIKERVRGSQA